MLGLPSHITLLYPFMPLETASPEHLSQLAHIFDHTPSIRFVLSEVGWFDQRVLYLRPDVADQFVDLTAAIVKEFPEFPPYGGAFDEVLPHLTVLEDAPIEQMKDAERRIRRKVPIKGVATEVWLVHAEQSSGRCHVVRRFPLRRGTR